MTRPRVRPPARRLPQHMPAPKPIHDADGAETPPGLRVFDKHDIPPDFPVWVFANGMWRPGVVEKSTGAAALVTYRRGASGIDLTKRFPHDHIRRRPEGPR